MIEYYSIADIKKIIGEQFNDFVFGEYYVQQKTGLVYRFDDIKTRLLVYDPRTYDAKWMDGMFFEFHTDNGLIHYSVGKPKKGEYKRVKSYKSGS